MEDEFNRGELIVLENGVTHLLYDDLYEHLDPFIEYFVENVFFKTNSKTENSIEFQELDNLYNSVYTKGCNCNSDLSDCSTNNEVCFHGGNYIVTKLPNDSMELTLNPNRKCKDLIYECFEQCKCSRMCRNRLVQYGPRKNLKIVNSKNIPNQKGLITTESIPAGGFICEYAGEIITKYEAKRRHLNNIQSNQMNYILCLNEHSIDSDRNLDEENISTEAQALSLSTEKKISRLTAKTSGETSKTTNLFQTFIDPSKNGNIGRYLNHSCEPNCQIISVRVDGPVPKLGIFAKRNIERYEELCFHYADGFNSNLENESKEEQNNGKKRPCYCGSRNCQKFLPNLKF